MGQESEEDFFENTEVDNFKDSDVIEIDDSSIEEERMTESHEPDEVAPEKTKSSADFGKDDTIEPWKFGEVVDLDFLRARSKSEDSQDDFVVNPTDDAPVDEQKPANDCDSSTEDNITRPSSETPEEENVDSDLTHESDGELEGKESFVTSRPRSQKRRKISKPSREKRDSLREDRNLKRAASETSEEKHITTDRTHESDCDSDGKDSSVTSAARSQKRRKMSAYA